MTTSSDTDMTGPNLSQARCRPDWLALAASPTFAFMAWAETGNMAMLCASGPGILPFNSMTVMYLLMSLFHLSAWLKIGSGRTKARN